MTFSVEYDNQEIDIILLDPTGCDNDCQVTIVGKEVWIRQQCPETDQVDLILISYSMLTDLATAINKPEGVFIS